LRGSTAAASPDRAVRRSVGQQFAAGVLDLPLFVGIDRRTYHGACSVLVAAIASS
jgi:hypothetical protein